MIVLDTDVISELMRPEPHPDVFAWVAAPPRDALYTTSITHAEILYGVCALPTGKRRDALTAVAEGIFEEEFAGRMLAFQGTAAVHCNGHCIAGFDALIAATALAAGAKIDTRDVAGFYRVRPDDRKSLGCPMKPPCLARRYRTGGNAAARTGDERRCSAAMRFQRRRGKPIQRCSM